MSNSGRKLVFLLGSGVSIPAGMPKTQEITEQVLSGKDIIRHEDGNYDFDKPQYDPAGFPDEYIPRLRKFIKNLKLETDKYYENQLERHTNYEDLYYIASQIYDSEVGEYDNPIVQPFINKILPKIRSILVCKENELRQQKWGIHELASEATNYIRDIVWSLLSENPVRLDYLGCISDAFQDDGLLSVDMFTLNHDTVLEQRLSQNGVQFIDGFGGPVNNVRYWNPDLFEEPARV